jgi:excisionase family DNA binding protein
MGLPSFSGGSVGTNEDRNAGEIHFMTVSEVAASLRVSTMTVYRLINGGELPAARIGRSFRVRAEDLDTFVADHFTAAG